MCTNRGDGITINNANGDGKREVSPLFLSAILISPSLFV